MVNKQQSPKSLSGLLGFAVFSLCVVGVGSAILALLAIVESYENFLAAGVLLIASSISFGQLLNSLLRR